VEFGNRKVEVLRREKREERKEGFFSQEFAITSTNYNCSSQWRTNRITITSNS
jgi:hypothetical protein